MNPLYDETMRSHHHRLIQRAITKEEISFLTRQHFWQSRKSVIVNTSRLFSFSHLTSPTEKDYDSLSSLLNHGGSILTENLERYNTDWTGHFKGSSKIVVCPASVEEVSSVLAYCNRRSLGVVAQGGNTGLVGGSVPVSDEVILSLASMSNIYSSFTDDDDNILTCDAGCILQTLQDYASEKNRLVPIDLGSKGSCQIGGNISTNAGGQYFDRFGSLHANVLGLEVVLANGRVLNLLNKNRKDNTGYHLQHLFIGAEGTLGVVTKVNLYCPTKPTSKHVALVACETFEHVIRTLQLAKAHLGEILAAYEFIDQNALDLAGSIIPFHGPSSNNYYYPFYVLVETQGFDMEHDSIQIHRFLEKTMETGIVVDGIVAQDGKQIQNLWEIRESLAPKISAKGYVYKYDVSLPRLLDFHDIVLEMNARLSSHYYNLSQGREAKIVTFGHVADGNLHFNVVTPGKFEKDDYLLKNALEPYLFHSVIRRKGSIAAEHGLGCSKNKYLPLVKCAETLEMMRAMKLLLDPKGILNPGKVL